MFSFTRGTQTTSINGTAISKLIGATVLRTASTKFAVVNSTPLRSDIGKSVKNSSRNLGAIAQSFENSVKSLGNVPPNVVKNHKITDFFCRSVATHVFSRNRPPIYFNKSSVLYK